MAEYLKFSEPTEDLDGNQFLILKTLNRELLEVVSEVYETQERLDPNFQMYLKNVNKFLGETLGIIKHLVESQKNRHQRMA